MLNDLMSADIVANNGERRASIRRYGDICVPGNSC